MVETIDGSYVFSWPFRTGRGSSEISFHFYRKHGIIRKVFIVLRHRTIEDISNVRTAV